MAWQLVAEVLDHAPQELTPAERLVLVAIAEASHRGDGRRWTGPQAELARRTGLPKRALREALGRLAGRGLDPRVPIGTDRRGLPVYAYPGTSPTFAVPVLPAPPGCPCSTCPQGDVTTAPSVDNPVGNPVDTSVEGDAPTAPSASKVPPQRHEGAATTAPSPDPREQRARGRAPGRARPRTRGRARGPGPGQSPLVALASRATRSCPMCDAEGRLLEVGRFVPVSPTSTCDHTSDHAAQVARARAEPA